LSPNPTQVRNHRIDRLVEYGEQNKILERDITAYSRLLRLAKGYWPKVADMTQESYVKAALRILRAEKNT